MKTKEMFYAEYINETCTELFRADPKIDIVIGSPTRILVDRMALMAWEIQQLREKLNVV